MTAYQFAIWMMAPAGALIVAAVVLYLTRDDRSEHPHPGE